jgi:glycosyltransferase involved in cell wall biosynthesis
VIVLASVLKPVDDTRNFEKIATSISNTNKYEINIIGFCPKILPTKTNIIFHPIFKFHRLSFKRLIAPIKTFQILLKLKPELIIVTTPELLSVMCVIKILFGCKIIYDVQENYYRNILFTGVYSVLVKFPLAIWIRWSEWLSKPFIDQYLLAEKVYKEQLRFAKNKSEILENKALIPLTKLQRADQKKDVTTFIYTGTIASHYGIFEAINFIRRIFIINSAVELIIIGYAPSKKIYKKVLFKIKDLNYIKIVGGDKLVPHCQILKELINADFCLMPYHKNKSSEGRIPTKLYECLALEKPVIITPNDAWNQIVDENQAGIIYDFNSKSIPDSVIKPPSFYGKNLSKKYVWDSEESKLLALINNMI